MARPLSYRADQVYEYIRSFVYDHGYPPTVREIVAGCGLGSSSTASRYLDQLEIAGRITRGGNGRIGVVEWIKAVDQVTQLEAANRLLYQAATRWREIAEARRCQ